MNAPTHALAPCRHRLTRLLPGLLPWPLPALLAWAAGWGLWLAARRWGLPPAAGFGLGLLGGVALALVCQGRWRRGIAGLGFPLSALALGAAGTMPAWLWLLMLLAVLAVYPLRAWRDAPLFPTPQDALAGLDAVLHTPPQRVLDAGCGLGHGLAALHRLWPAAQISGVEWSPLLAAASALRCRYARVRRGDMWAASWAGFDVIYLFQRPESMARAFKKLAAEARPGTWLVSLEFAVPGQPPVACLQGPQRRPLWVYQPSGPLSPAIPVIPACHSTTAPGGR